MAETTAAGARTATYSVWRDHATKSFEVVMWVDRHPMVVKYGIKTQERAHKIAAQYRVKERAAIAKTGGA